MATNIVSLVMQFLTPEVIGRITTALGFDRNKVEFAIEAAVPSLLAAFNNVAIRPGGAQKLAIAAKQQISSLGNFGSMLAAEGQSSFPEKGSQMLASLVGSQNQNALTEAVAKFTGLSQSASGSLLGMLAPIVMGTIGQQRGEAQAIDAESVAKLFAGQKDNIVAALPSGFGDLLRGTGVLNSLGGAPRTAIAAGGELSRVAAYAVSSAAGQRTSTRVADSFNWHYWVISTAVITAALIFLFLLDRPTEEVVQHHGMNQAQNLAVGRPDVAKDLSKQVADSITRLRATLDGVTDVASAQAALPKLQEASAQIDRTSGEVGQLSADQRKLVAGLVNPLVPVVNQLCDKVLAIPGVAEALKPSVDTLRAKLTAFVVEVNKMEG